MKNWGVLVLWVMMVADVYSCPVVIDSLLSRLMPQQKEQIVVKIRQGTKQNYYKITASGRQIVIEGNSPVSVASGIHRYMKECLNISVSWTDMKPELPGKLPLPSRVIREESPYRFVTYMNYCTFGYSAAYWDWERWEQEIDWMAMHGVTHPLAMVGVEVVWRNFLRQQGYTDAEVKAFLTGPAYLPWLLMGNMQGLGGPLPDEWFERQEKLQKKILARMREYGMEPVFQAFYGMVPSSFKEKYPQRQIVEQGKWNTFDRPDVLSPLDPGFSRLAESWYREYKALFGTSGFYAGDLFHEGGKTGKLDVTACAKAVEAAMRKANPKAVWVLQSWGPNPSAALLKGLDPEHALVVELCAEYWHRWKDQGGYEGIPWAWSNISNWGGNIGLHGRLEAIATQPVAAFGDKKAAKTLVGIGFTPEGIETNPVVPALWGDMVWRKKPLQPEEWIERYPVCRYGSERTSLKMAWQGFLRTVYGTFPGSRRPSESVFCAAPSLNVKTVSAWSQCRIYYDPGEYARACCYLLEDTADLRGNLNYQYDAVDMVRQYLADLGRETYVAIQLAWKQQNQEAFESNVTRFLELIRDQDELLLTHPAFSLEGWLKEARLASQNTGIQNQYEYYHRLLITSWDKRQGALNDYAHREIGGLLGSYYYKRWELYFNYLKQRRENPEMPPPVIYGWTQTWLYQDIGQDLKQIPVNPVDMAVRKFKKYYKQM